MARVQTASMEDYLEAVAILQNDKRHPVRVSQISKALGVKMPSVTSAVRKLSKEGLVKHESYGYVELTSEGDEIAKDVIRRHDTLRRFFVEILNMDADVASEDACRMEHSLSPTALERLSKFVEFALSCPRGEPEWLKNYNYYLVHGIHSAECLSGCECE